MSSFLVVLWHLVPIVGASCLLNTSLPLHYRADIREMGLALKKPDGAAGASWPAIVIGLFVAFGGVLFGYVRIHPQRNPSISMNFIRSKYRVL